MNFFCLSKIMLVQLLINKPTFEYKRCMNKRALLTPQDFYCIYTWCTWHDVIFALTDIAYQVCNFNDISAINYANIYTGILLPKLFWPTVRKNCSSDREKLFKFEAEDRDFENILWFLELFIQTVKVQKNFW
jgi:hypothetical protein